MCGRVRLSDDFSEIKIAFRIPPEFPTPNTYAPSWNVAPIHDRQMVIVERSDWSAWLEKIGNETELLRALPAGSLEVEQIRP